MSAASEAASLPVVHRYRKVPVVIEAVRFETNNDPGEADLNRVVRWVNSGLGIDSKTHAWHNGTDLFIDTLEGRMHASVGDYIIRGVKGEFYPCKPDVFEATYKVLP